MAIAYLNGEWMAPEETRVSVFDRGFMFGDGVYEVLAVYSGKIFLLEAHLTRLNRSLEAIHLRSPYDDHAWSSLLQLAVDKSGEEDGYLYLQITRGVQRIRSHVYSGEAEPTVLVTMMPGSDEPQNEPLRVVTKQDYRWQRADIKVTSLIANGLLKNEALEEGYDEAVLVREGMITEATSANIFIVSDGVILTPPRSHMVLHGVTRDYILSLARQAGFPIEEREIFESEFLGADEAWISSTGNEIRAVIEINGIVVGDGWPGKVFRELDALFQSTKAHS